MSAGITSGYEVLQDDRPTQSEWATRMMERNRVDVLIHDGKALVTPPLYGGIETPEFRVLMVGGSGNDWRLLRSDKGPAIAATILIDIRPWWGLKDVADPLRIAVYYPPHLGMRTCKRVFGEIGIRKP